MYMKLMPHSINDEINASIELMMKLMSDRINDEINSP